MKRLLLNGTKTIQRRAICFQHGLNQGAADEIIQAQQW